MDGLEAVRQRLEESLVPQLKETPLLAAIITVLVLVVTTRLFTGGSSSQGSPPLAPYWIPLFGHAPRLFLNANFTLTRFRNRYAQGIFSIRLFQSIHSFVFRPSLASKLLELPESVADKEQVARRLMVTNFRLSKNDLEAYDKVASEIHQVTKQYLSGSHLDGLVKANVGDLDDVAAELVSFNSYQTDQMDWERQANAFVVETETEKVMDVDFLELMRNYVARSATASVFGVDFVQNFDDIWPHLWVFNDGFLPLAMGVPVWAPLPTSQRARIALGRLHAFMQEFHEDLDKFLNNDEPGVIWQDFHTISPLVRKRTEIFRKHNLSIDVRASFDVALFWSVTINSTSMVSWSLFELYQDPVLLAQIRDQITPYVQVVQPKNEFGGAVWVPPKIEKLDMDGLVKNCPLLEAVYLETLRLHGEGWSARYLKEDAVLKDDGASYVLKKGTFAHIVSDLHRTDPKVFSDARIWNAGRYLEDDVDAKGAKTQKVNPKMIQPSDGTLTMCDDSAFTMRKVYMYISVLISLYSIEPPKGGDWVTPKLVKGVASSRPSKAIRLWIKPRALPKAK